MEELKRRVKYKAWLTGKEMEKAKERRVKEREVEIESVVCRERERRK